MAIGEVLAATLLLGPVIGTPPAIGLSGYRATSPIRAKNTRVLQNPLIALSVVQSNSVDSLQQAESLLEKQQYAEAEPQLQTLAKSQAGNPQVWFDLGFAESHLGKNTDAVAAYKKAAALSPQWFEANLNLGLALAKSGNLTDAATALRAATELKPTSGGQQALGNAWFSLAQVLEGAAPKEALAAYQKAAELNPGNAEACLGAGKLMERQGDAADAESWLRKYLEANPHNAAVQLQLGRTLAAEGKTQEAISLLEAINNASPNAALTRQLASLYLEAKQYDGAAKILQELVQKNPNDGQLHCDLGSALLHQHKYPEAERELLQGLRLNPHQDDAYWELAYAAQQNKHYELAIRVLDARAQRLPETAGTYWIRAVSYDGLGAFKPAAQNYKLFLAADAGKSPDDEFKARHRLKAIEKQ